MVSAVKPHKNHRNSRTRMLTGSRDVVAPRASKMVPTKGQKNERESQYVVVIENAARDNRAYYASSSLIFL